MVNIRWYLQIIVFYDSGNSKWKIRIREVCKIFAISCWLKYSTLMNQFSTPVTTTSINFTINISLDAYQLLKLWQNKKGRNSFKMPTENVPFSQLPVVKKTWFVPFLFCWGFNCLVLNGSLGLKPRLVLLPNFTAAIRYFGLKGSLFKTTNNLQLYEMKYQISYHISKFKHYLLFSW